MENELSRIPLILLAGGKSFRVGFPKGLMPVGEKTWVECQCEKFEKIGGKDAILVLGFDAEAYSEAGKRLQAPQYISQLNMQVVINPLPEHGPFSSIQAGIKVALEMNSTTAAAGSDFPGVFVLPIDVPVPEKEVWLALSEAFTAETQVVQPVYRDGDRLRGGHPVLISRNEMSKILEMSSSGRLDERLRALSAASEKSVKRVEVKDSGILTNLNTKEEWDRYFRK
jgi:CTP:molybdopterin cytidylyltransferase MocA